MWSQNTEHTLSPPIIFGFVEFYIVDEREQAPDHALALSLHAKGFCLPCYLGVLLLGHFLAPCPAYFSPLVFNTINLYYRFLTFYYLFLYTPTPFIMLALTYYPSDFLILFFYVFTLICFLYSFGSFSFAFLYFTMSSLLLFFPNPTVLEEGFALPGMQGVSQLNLLSSCWLVSSHLS